MRAGELAAPGLANGVNYDRRVPAIAEDGTRVVAKSHVLGATTLTWALPVRPAMINVKFGNIPSGQRNCGRDPSVSGGAEVKASGILKSGASHLAT